MRATASLRAAFENVEPTWKRLLLAIDVSGSMGGGSVAGVPGLTPRRFPDPTSQGNFPGGWPRSVASTPIRAKAGKICNPGPG